MKDFLGSLLKMAGIVYLRFPPVPRIWCIWLAGANAASLIFIQHLEAQILLATTTVAVLGMTLIHSRTGFTRLLGVAHFLWIPMFAWMATRFDDISAHPNLQIWLVVVLATNAVCCMIDAIDVTRFVRGERASHYSWS